MANTIENPFDPTLLLASFGVVFCVILGVAVFAFLIALWRKNYGLADVFWGLFFIVAAWWSYQLSSSSLGLALGVLVTVWGLRLSGHILKRNWGKPEDFRYAQWREEWRCPNLRAFFQVFILQGLLAFLIVTPVLWVNFMEADFTAWFYVGFAVWLLGFLFEAGGDYQLAQFVKVKKPGQIMKTGFWRYTRHPNYFGEVTQWWGIWLATLCAPYAVVFVFSPLLISFLILYVSGIPMLEKKYENNQEFQDYKKRTSAFFPWFPKK